MVMEGDDMSDYIKGKKVEILYSTQSSNGAFKEVGKVVDIIGNSVINGFCFIQLENGIFISINNIIKICVVD